MLEDNISFKIRKKNRFGHGHKYIYPKSPG